MHNRICSYNCFTNGFGQYCNSAASGKQYKNYVIESTLSNTNYNLGYAPIWFQHGNLCLTKSNISYIRIKSLSGYGFGQSSPELIQEETNFTYNSILNNTSNEGQCIGHYSTYNPKLFRCNIINNSGKEYLIYNYHCDHLTFKECNIIDNSANKTFHIYDESTSYKIEVIDSYLKNEGTVPEYIIIKYPKNTAIENELSHFSTELCKTKPKYINRTSPDEIKVFSLFSFCILLFASKDMSNNHDLEKPAVYNRHYLLKTFSLKSFISLFFK